MGLVDFPLDWGYRLQLGVTLSRFGLSNFGRFEVTQIDRGLCVSREVICGSQPLYDSRVFYAIRGKTVGRTSHVAILQTHQLREEFAKRIHGSVES